MRKYLFLIIACLIPMACFAQKKVVKIEPQVQVVKQDGYSLKRKVAIARFSNET